MSNLKAFGSEHFVISAVVVPEGLCSLLPLSCLTQPICRSCVSVRHKLSGCMCKGLLPSSGESGQRPVKFTLEKKKHTYKCPIIPVQLCMEAVTQLEIFFYFFISEFHILFTSQSDTVRCEREGDAAQVWESLPLPSTLRLPAE